MSITGPIDSRSALLGNTRSWRVPDYGFQGLGIYQTPLVVDTYTVIRYP